MTNVAQVGVVVDTTATFTDVMMSHTRWIQLLSLCAKGEIRVAIPDVVLRETARHWETEAKKALDALTSRVDRIASSQDRLSGLGFDITLQVPPPVPGVVIDRQRFLADATSRLLAIGVEILPLPDVTIERVLERDLENRKPFAANGKGFRDTLVWESVKQFSWKLNPSSVLYFVTDNTDDYCLGNELHPDLAVEVEGAHSELRHVKNLEDLLSQVDLKVMVAGLVADDAELSKFLARARDSDESDYEPLTVEQIVASALVAAAEGLAYEEVQSGNSVSSGLDFTDVAIPREIESPTVSYVEYDEESVDWETFETYDDTTLLVRGTIDATVILEGFVYKSDYAVVDDGVVQLMTWDWNDHMAQVSTTVRARLVFQLRVEVGVGVDDVEFEAAEPLT